LARRNAMHFISTDRPEWDKTVFLAEGHERLALLAARVGIDPSTWHGTAVDLGCGIGRFSFALASYFTHVLAFDVSQEMITRAQAIAYELGNQRVTFQRNNGSDIRDVPDQSCDLAYSYVVLQHIPDLSIVRGYIGELARVVRPGGQVLFQVLTYRVSLAATLLRLLRPGIVRLLGVAEAAGLVKPEQGMAFQGSRMTLAQVEQVTQAYGLEIVAIRRSDAGHLLCDETLVYCRRKNQHHG
jgi:ubiquinone/menaquinone biosynthesis C-methylase UbiE